MVLLEANSISKVHDVIYGLFNQFTIYLFELFLRTVYPDTTP